MQVYNLIDDLEKRIGTSRLFHLPEINQLINDIKLLENLIDKIDFTDTNQLIICIKLDKIIDRLKKEFPKKYSAIVSKYISEIQLKYNIDEFTAHNILFTQEQGFKF